MRVLLDTNVVIDYFARREPFYQDVFKLRIMEEFGDVELWVSIQSFADIANILRGHSDSAMLQDSFLASLDFLRVCSLDQGDLRNAIAEKWPDFEDCLIEQCAKKTKADFIVSRDSTGFSSSSVTAISPSDFFKLLSEEHGIVYDFVEQ